MTPSLLDVNVLLALTWPSHQHHQAVHRWFGRESRHGWATCALTQLAFVRLSANPSFSPDFVTPQEAATLLVRLAAHEQHRFWSDLPALDVAALKHAHGHQQVMDAYLVQLARHHGGRVVTFDTRLAAHAIRDHEVTTIGS